METIADFIFRKLPDIKKYNDIYYAEIFKYARNMEYDLIKRLLNSRENTRSASFQIGLKKGFELALKSAEDYYEKLSKTEMDEDDFTNEYIKENFE